MQDSNTPANKDSLLSGDAKRTRLHPAATEQAAYAVHSTTEGEWQPKLTRHLQQPQISEHRPTTTWSKPALQPKIWAQTNTVEKHAQVSTE